MNLYNVLLFSGACFTNKSITMASDADFHSRWLRSRKRWILVQKGCSFGIVDIIPLCPCDVDSPHTSHFYSKTEVYRDMHYFSYFCTKT